MISTVLVVVVDVVLAVVVCDSGRYRIILRNRGDIGSSGSNSIISQDIGSGSDSNISSSNDISDDSSSDSISDEDRLWL